MTAGELATRSGLTTGAVTTVVDRLEKSGYARRVRDKIDRRKVFIELTEFTQQIVAQLYGPMGEAYGLAMQNLSVADLRIIAQYLEFTARINSAHAEILQTHLPTAKTDNKTRMQQAKAFAKAGRAINNELAASWGSIPESPPITGKPYDQIEP